MSRADDGPPLCKVEAAAWWASQEQELPKDKALGAIRGALNAVSNAIDECDEYGACSNVTEALDTALGALGQAWVELRRETKPPASPSDSAQATPSPPATHDATPLP